MWWIILVLAMAVAALFMLRARLKFRNDRAVALADRMRTTTLYKQLLPVISDYEDGCVEQILIRSEEVAIRLFKPARKVVRFNFSAHGIPPVENPDALQALARALPQDLPSLDDPSKFWFARRTANRDLKTKDVWYEYNVQPAFRDLQLRAAYDKIVPGDDGFC